MRVTYAEVKFPRWKLRAIITVFVLLILTVAGQAYRSVQGSVEGELAVKQLSNDPAERALGRAAAQSDLPGTVWAVSTLLIVGGLWLPFGLKVVKYYQAKDVVQPDVQA